VKYILIATLALAGAAGASAQMMPGLPGLPQLGPMDLPPIGVALYLQSNSGSYLGNFGSPLDPNSIYNPFGEYGSRFSQDSINNPFGQYGSPFSPNSATNPFAITPPRLVYRNFGSYPYSVNPFAQ